MSSKKHSYRWGSFHEKKLDLKAKWGRWFMKIHMLTRGRRFEWWTCERRWRCIWKWMFGRDFSQIYSDNNMENVERTTWMMRWVYYDAGLWLEFVVQREIWSLIHSDIFLIKQAIKTPINYLIAALLSGIVATTSKPRRPKILWLSSIVAAEAIDKVKIEVCGFVAWN